MKCLVPTLSILGLLFLVSPRSASAQDMMGARATYDLLCANCHGVQGDGKGAFGVGQVPPPTDFTRSPPGRIDADADGRAATPMDFALVTRDGAAAYQGSPSMPPIVNLGGRAELVPDLVAFIFAEFVPRRAGGGAALSVGPAVVAGLEGPSADPDGYLLRPSQVLGTPPDR